MTQKNTESFEQNFKRLEQFAKELQGNEVTIDVLIPRMKEALAAVKVCKDVLKKTQSQLHELSAEFADLEEPATAKPA